MQTVRKYDIFLHIHIPVLWDYKRYDLTKEKKIKNVHIGDRRLFLIIDEVWCERKWRKTYWYSFNGQTPPYLMGKYKMYCVYIWKGARSLVQIQGVYIYLSILKFLPLHTVYTFNRGPPPGDVSQKHSRGI